MPVTNPVSSAHRTVLRMRRLPYPSSWTSTPPAKLATQLYNAHAMAVKMNPKMP
jgi:hypothetical protein